MDKENATQRTTNDFLQLKLLFTDPLQNDYEVIRPIALFAETTAACSVQTRIERSTIGEKARHFVQKYMLGFLDQRSTHSGRKLHTFPEPIATNISNNSTRQSTIAKSFASSNQIWLRPMVEIGRAKVGSTRSQKRQLSSEQIHAGLGHLV